MSGRPSLFKSATATEVGPSPTAHRLTRLEGAVAVAELHGHRVLEHAGGDHVEIRRRRSGRPRPRNSFARPRRWSSGGWNVPSPLPKSTLTVLALRLPTTRSSLPSPFRSAIASEAGPLPAGKVCCAAERAVAVAQEHAHGVAAVVGRDDVGDAVASQVRDLHFVRALAHAVILRGAINLVGRRFSPGSRGR